MGAALAARVHLLEHLACGSLADAGTAASARSFLLARMLAEEAAALSAAGTPAEGLNAALVRHRRLEDEITRSVDTGAAHSSVCRGKSAGFAAPWSRQASIQFPRGQVSGVLF